MKCRGYCGRLYLFDTMLWQGRDTCLIVGVVVFSAFAIFSGAYAT
jgi:hypothetical protein